jgi:hypothetical protein
VRSVLAHNLGLTSPPAEPTLEDRAAKVTQDYLAIIAQEGQNNRTIVARAIRVGKDLLDLKDKVGHGNWEDWVETNLPQFNYKKVQRWMNLAKNEEKIKDAVKEREGNNKKDTVSFLTLREALAIANAKGGNGGGAGDTYERVEARLLKKLQPLDFNNADTVVTSTIRKLKEALAQKKAA